MSSIIKKYQIFYINSQERQTGTESNFSIKLEGIDKNNNFKFIQFQEHSKLTNYNYYGLRTPIKTKNENVNERTPSFSEEQEFKIG